MRQPMQVFFGGSGKGIDITASNFAAETWDDEVDEYEAPYEVNDDADTAYSEPPPIRPYARPQRHRRTTRPFPSPNPCLCLQCPLAITDTLQSAYFANHV